jgi:hypothetical protein
LADARKTLGVEVEVRVGSSTSSGVAVETGVRVNMLEVGVSSTGVGVDAGAAVGWDLGKLQDDNPRFNTITAIQR